MFYTDEEVSVITGLLNAYLVREHASEKVRESYTRISEGLQSHALTRDDYVWLENALLFLRPYWWSDREDGRKWLFTAATIKNGKTAEIQIINDYGSEDLIATLTTDDGKNFKLKQVKGSTLKIARNRKWLKMPKELDFVKR